MSRTVQEIKRQMTDLFMSDKTIRERYNLKESDTFESRFSVVSIESILFFVIASAHYVLEQIFECFKNDVSNQIESSIVATTAWYHKQALKYQHGDSLILDEKTLQYRYQSVDKNRQIVRYASAQDLGNSVQICVSKDLEGSPVPLSSSKLTAFTSYMNNIKIAGVVLSVRSLPADQLSIAARIQVDSLVFTSSGVRIRDQKHAVEDAINDYVKKIKFGGVFNKTHLVDAIQRVDGVVDVELLSCSAATHNSELKLIDGNNYTAWSGCFTTKNLRDTLSYSF